jgi:hypothetical protein
LLIKGIDTSKTSNLNTNKSESLSKDTL